MKCIHIDGQRMRYKNFSRSQNEFMVKKKKSALESCMNLSEY